MQSIFQGNRLRLESILISINCPFVSNSHRLLPWSVNEQEQIRLNFKPNLPTINSPLFFHFALLNKPHCETGILILRFINLFEG